MDRSAYVAVPATALTVVVPANVAPAAFSSDTDTAPLKPVARLPNASRAWTTTAGAMVAPAVVVLGWTEYTSEAVAAALMSNPAEVAEARVPELATSVYPL